MDFSLHKTCATMWTKLEGLSANGRTSACVLLPEAGANFVGLPSDVFCQVISNPKHVIT